MAAIDQTVPAAEDRFRNAQAIGWCLVGTALFSIVFASAKFGNASPLQIMWLRYVSGFALVATIAIARGGVMSHRSAKPLSHLMRALFGCYGGVAIVHASAEMPILDASAISLLSVIFIVMLGVVILRERVTGLQWIAIALATAGAFTIVLSRGGFQTFDLSYIWPATVALGSAVLIGLEAILIRTLSQAERALTVLLHVNFCGILLIAIPAFVTWQPIGLMETALILMLGPIAIFGQFCNILGYRRASVSIVGPVDYTWLVFAALIGLLFFGEVPGLGTVLGAVLIACGGLLLSLRRG